MTDETAGGGARRGGGARQGGGGGGDSSTAGPRKGRRALAGGALLLAAALSGGYLTVARAGPAGLGGPSAMTDSARSVRQAFAGCASRSAQAKSDCYQVALSQRLRAAGIAAAMATLQGLYALDPDVERDAHVHAHYIGIEGYQLNPSVEETFAECSDIYSSGCYHGVIQAYFEDRGVVDRETVNEMCAPYKGEGQSRWILFQCLHGMGHGLTMLFHHRLPRALEACDLLEHGWDRESCYGGAFMENIVHAMAPHHPAAVLAEKAREGGEPDGAHRRHGAMDHGGDGAAVGDAGGEEHASHGQETARDPAAGTGTGPEKLPPFEALDPEDLLYPCSVMEERYLPACYLMQTSVILHLNGGDIPGAAEACGEAPFHLRPICYQSLGRDIAAFARQHPDRTIRLCAAVREPHLRDCYVGAVKALVDWRSAAEPGLKFCRKVEGSENKRRCYRALGEQIGALAAAREEREELCGRSEAEWVETCRAGAWLPPAGGP